MLQKRCAKSSITILPTGVGPLIERQASHKYQQECYMHSKSPANRKAFVALIQFSSYLHELCVTSGVSRWRGATMLTDWLNMSLPIRERHHRWYIVALLSVSWRWSDVTIWLIRCIHPPSVLRGRKGARRDIHFVLNCLSLSCNRQANGRGGHWGVLF